MTYRPIFYDTETTGVKSDKDRIVEIAAYDPVQDKTFHSLINPNCPIPKQASEIHHITDDMVQEAPTFEQVIPKLTDFCDEETVLIAHNNDAFDKPFLQSEFERCNTPFPNWKFIDSLKWARRYRYDLPRHSLQFLREVYEIPANQAHRALDDVIVLHKVFMKMVDDLSMEQILKLLSDATSERMPFGKYQGRPLKDVPKDYVTWLMKSGAFEKRENESLKEHFQKLGVLSC